MMIVAWFWGCRRKHIITELARNQSTDTDSFMIVNLTKTLNILQTIYELFVGASKYLINIAIAMMLVVGCAMHNVQCTMYNERCTM